MSQNMIQKNEKNINIIKIYCDLMILGHKAGCHQRADRSFFWRGFQFPLCARCTGLLVSYIISLPMYLIFGGNLWICIFLMAVMFVDWFLQYLKIRESTNLRRIITGICGGYGIMTIQIILFQYILSMIM